MDHMGLVSKLNSLFGSSWIEVEDPSTLAIMFSKAGIDIDDKTSDLVNALKSLVLSSLPWEDPFVFENVVDALNGNPLIVTTITKPNLSDIMYAVHVMIDIDPNSPFSEDVINYIASVAIDSQFVYLPAPLEFVNNNIPPDDMGLAKKLQRLSNSYHPIDAGEGETPLSIQLLKILNLKEIFEAKLFE